jgi:hypothetical protein
MPAKKSKASKGSGGKLSALSFDSLIGKLKDFANLPYVQFLIRSLLEQLQEQSPPPVTASAVRNCPGNVANAVQEAFDLSVQQMLGLASIAAHLESKEENDEDGGDEDGGDEGEEE